MTRFESYYQSADDVMCVVMVETVEAVDNIVDIVSVPGVDVVYVGPNDLAISMGLLPGERQVDADFVAALGRIVEACTRHDVIPGVHADASLATAHRSAGFRMITVASDQSAAVDGLVHGLARSRR